MKKAKNEFEIKVCKYCGKVDIRDSHEESCSYSYVNSIDSYNDNLWK